MLNPFKEASLAQSARTAEFTTGVDRSLIELAINNDAAEASRIATRSSKLLVSQSVGLLAAFYFAVSAIASMATPEQDFFKNSLLAGVSLAFSGVSKRRKLGMSDDLRRMAHFVMQDRHDEAMLKYAALRSDEKDYTIDREG